MYSTETLLTLRNKVLNRLGDADVQIWTEAEIEAYIIDGYNELCRASRALWDIAYLENLPYTGNHNHLWESADEYFTAAADAVITLTGNRSSTIPAVPIRTKQGRFIITQPWEHQHLPTSYEPPPPANHTAPWERVGGHLDVTHIPAVVRLPDAYLETDRATNDWQRLTPMRSVELERRDIHYETGEGTVEAYTQDKDGLRNLRKYKVPATAASEHNHIGRYGFIVSVQDENAVTAGGMRIDEFARTADGSISAADRARILSVGFSILGGGASTGTYAGMPEWADSPIKGGPYGFPRVLPGYFPIGGPYGFPRRVIEETNNFRLEHYRRGKDLAEGNPFELPRAYVKYVRHYAMHRALNKDGDGQDLKLGAHYRARYEAGLQRIENRKAALASNRAGVIGGGAEYSSRPGHPVPPPIWNTREWRP